MAPATRTATDGVSDMDVILVTGIGGFIGRHIAAELLRAGFSVRGTLRDAGRTGEIEATIRAAAGPSSGAISFATADLLADRLAEALQGVAAVIHSASPFPHARTGKRFGPGASGAGGNAEGPFRCAAGGRGARGADLLHRGRLLRQRAVRPSRKGLDGSGRPLTTPYYRSKTLAERAAWDLRRRRASRSPSSIPASCSAR